MITSIKTDKTNNIFVNAHICIYELILSKRSSYIQLPVLAF